MMKIQTKTQAALTKKVTMISPDIIKRISLSGKLSTHIIGTIISFKRNTSLRADKIKTNHTLSLKRNTIQIPKTVGTMMTEAMMITLTIKNMVKKNMIQKSQLSIQKVVNSLVIINQGEVIRVKQNITNAMAVEKANQRTESLRLILT
jgi:hypothetical protein